MKKRENRLALMTGAGRDISLQIGPSALRQRLSPSRGTWPTHQPHELT